MIQNDKCFLKFDVFDRKKILTARQCNLLQVLQIMRKLIFSVTPKAKSDVQVFVVDSKLLEGLSETPYFDEYIVYW